MLDPATTLTLLAAIVMIAILSLVFFYADKNIRTQKDALNLNGMQEKPKKSLNQRTIRNLDQANKQEKNMSESKILNLSSQSKMVLGDFFYIPDEAPKSKSTIKYKNFEKIEHQQDLEKENDNNLEYKLYPFEEMKKEQMAGSNLKKRRLDQSKVLSEKIGNNINGEKEKKNNKELHVVEKEKKNNNEFQSLSPKKQNEIKIPAVSLIPEKNEISHKLLNESSKPTTIDQINQPITFKTIQSVIMTEQKKIELPLPKVNSNLEEEKKVETLNKPIEKPIIKEVKMAPEQRKAEFPLPKLNPKLEEEKKVEVIIPTSTSNIAIEKPIFKEVKKAPELRRAEFEEEKEERKIDLHMREEKKEEKKNKINSLRIHADLDYHFLNKTKNQELDEIEQAVNKCLGSLLGDNISERLFETSRDLVNIYQRYGANEENCLFFYFKIIETIANNTLNIKLIGKVDDGQRNNIIDSLSRLSILLTLVNLDCPHMVDYMISYLQSEVRLLIPEDVLPKNEGNLSLDRFTSKVMMRSFCYFILINTDLSVIFLSFFFKKL